MTRSLPFLLLFVCLFSATATDAAPVVTSALRSILVDSEEDPPLSASTTSTSGPFIATSESGTGQFLTTANQVSDISATGFTGSGAVQTGFPDSIADSFFEVFFDLTVPHLLSGAATLPPTTEENASTSAVFFLTGPSISIVLTAGSAPPGSDPQEPLVFLFNELLAPGSYELEVLAHSEADPSATSSVGRASFDFNLLFEPQQEPGPSVPEPGTLLVLMAGATGLVAVRRFRSRP